MPFRLAFVISTGTAVGRLRGTEPTIESIGVGMNFRRVLAFTSLTLLVACTLAPTAARPQSSIQQCTWLQEKLAESLNAHSVKNIISVERQYLSYCKDNLQGEQFALELGTLASALNEDKQHQDAPGVANRCLQVNSTELACLFAKADALTSLGRLREAKSVIERSLTLGAITEIDAIVKGNLQNLLLQINAALNERPPVANAQTGSSNAITKLPGGVKCADLFNNNKLVCFLDIEIGVITSRTPEDVRYLIDHRDSYSRKISGSMVTLDSLGGNLAAAMEIGKLIRDQKLPTVIDSSAKCVSACVFVLAGAIQRKIRGAVGIHRPYFTTVENANSPDVIVRNYGEQLKQAREYLTSMGIADPLLDEMLRIEPNDVRYLSRVELNAFGLGEGPPANNIETVASLKEPVEIKSAAAYGLTRAEYNRRTALIDQTCKFGNYQSPFEPPDLSVYGRSVEELQMSARALLAHDLETEERGWSLCFKMIMTHGR
jgi:hypothetical protein